MGTSSLCSKRIQARDREEILDYRDVLASIRKDVAEALERATAAEAEIKKVKDELKLQEGVTAAGSAVNLRFLVQYAFQIVEAIAKTEAAARAAVAAKAAAEAPGTKSEKVSNLYKDFLSMMPETIEVKHTILGMNDTVACGLKPFLNILSSHGLLCGHFSNGYCHSGSLRSIAATIEQQLAKLKEKKATILPEKELKSLKGLFLELFKSSTEEVLNEEGNQKFVTEFFLPSVAGNRCSGG